MFIAFFAILTLLYMIFDGISHSTILERLEKIEKTQELAEILKKIDDINEKKRKIKKG